MWRVEKGKESTSICDFVEGEEEVTSDEEGDEYHPSKKRKVEDDISEEEGGEDEEFDSLTLNKEDKVLENTSKPLLSSFSSVQTWILQKWCPSPSSRCIHPVLSAFYNIIEYF